VRAPGGQPTWVSTFSDTRPARSGGNGIDLSTLVITAVASAAAAYTCSKIWAPGTLPSAAFMPVLVAIIKEALARPTQAVTRAVPIRGVVRSSPPESRPPAPPSLERVAQPGEMTYHATGGGMRRWHLAVVTGLLGFVVCVLVFTLPELIAGQSATGGGRHTTFFGGDEQGREQRTTTTTAPAKTVTAPATVTVPAPRAKTTTTPRTTTTAPVVPTATTPAPTSTVPTTTDPPADRP
jgi:hypothetical protein